MRSTGRTSADDAALACVATPAGFRTLSRLMRANMGRVDQIVLDNVRCEIPLAAEVARHVILAGGKRLRPIITLAMSEVCGYGGKQHLGLAASVEFMHTATLLHDDVVDGSDTRRGATCARSMWGNPASVLVGDFLLGRAFCLMVQAGDIAVLDILSRAASDIAKGEVHQLALAGRWDVSEQTLLEVIEAKTAVLFAAAAEVGPTLAGASGAVRSAARAYGRNVGMAYQLCDDVLDYTGDPGVMGKGRGDDLAERKMTVPTAIAYDRASVTDRATWREIFSARLDQAESLRRAGDMIRRYDVVAAVEKRCRAYVDAATSQLNALPPGELRDALEETAAACLSRSA